jgi:hypothetical protein
MSEQFPDLSDETLGRRLATELPRHAAPPHLRSAILAGSPPDPARPWWVAPALSAAATALLMGLFFAPLLPRSAPADPVERLTQAVVSEHERAVMWGARRADVIPTALPWLAQESGIGLSSVFPGDDRLILLEAEPVYLEQRRGLAVHYLDADGRRVTYVVLPAPSLVTPERQRQKVDRWRPALLHEHGFSVWMWKQRDLACFIVSAMDSQADQERFKDYFVRLRTATEPVRAY